MSLKDRKASEGKGVNVFVWHFKYGNLTITDDCPRVGKKFSLIRVFSRIFPFLFVTTVALIKKFKPHFKKYIFFN
jgi:hypothetical protein